MTKVCVSCKEEKTLSCFYKNSNNKDGYFSNCIVCLKMKRQGACQSCGNATSSKKHIRCKPCGAKATRGQNHYMWKGGKHINQDGYVRYTGFYDHPFANSDGKIFEHIFVMECNLGRKLLPKETVHHKNGDRADNRIENLELWSTSQPKGQRVADKIEWAKELLRLYDPESLGR